MKRVASFLKFLNIGMCGTKGRKFLSVLRYVAKELHFIYVCEKQFSNKVTVHFNFFSLGYPT